jgi:hypothetical protein
MSDDKNGKESGRWKMVAGILTTTATILAIIAFFTSWASLCQWVGLCSRDTYELAGAQAVLSLGQDEQLTVFRHKDEAASEPVQDLDCQWSYQPALPGLTTAGSCSVRITNLPSYFSAGGPPEFPLTAKVELWRRDSATSSAVARLSATTILRYAAIPAIAARVKDVLAGHRLAVDVTFLAPGHPTKFSCNWRPARLFADATACATEFLADPAIESDTTVTINVDVRGPDGASLGTASKDINVRTPPVDYLLYVMDDTARVALSASNGVPMLVDMRRDLMSSLAQPSAGVDRFLGLFIFGGPLPSKIDPASPEADCARFGAIYPVGPLDSDKAGQTLRALRAEGKRAPLIAAMLTALEAYRPYQGQVQRRPNDRFTLTIITASSDDCDPQGVKDFLSALASGLSERELAGISYDNRFLPIMLKLVDPGDAATRALLATEQYRSGEQPLAILLVSDSAVLSEALAAIAELAAGSPEARAHGCTLLIQLFDAQRDEAGAARIRRHCG